MAQFKVKPIDVDADEVLRTFVVPVRVHKLRRSMLRVRVGRCLLGLAAWILPVQLEIEFDED